jgi:aminoglycoside phosphotransferase (APT) family kinase protein
VHATLEARPDTRDLLAAVRQTTDRYLAAIPEPGDFVHYDFTLANLLTTGAGICGVIDIKPPALTGDRAFDLATILLIVTAVCDPLCGSTPMITAAIVMRLLRSTRGQRKIPWRARLIPEGARWRSRLF